MINSKHNVINDETQVKTCLDIFNAKHSLLYGYNALSFDVMGLNRETYINTNGVIENNDVKYVHINITSISTDLDISKMLEGRVGKDYYLSVAYLLGSNRFNNKGKFDLKLSNISSDRGFIMEYDDQEGNVMITEINKQWEIFNIHEEDSIGDLIKLMKFVKKQIYMGDQTEFDMDPDVNIMIDKQSSQAVWNAVVRKVYRMEQMPIFYTFRVQQYVDKDNTDWNNKLTPDGYEIINLDDFEENEEKPCNYTRFLLELLQNYIEYESDNNKYSEQIKELETQYKTNLDKRLKYVDKSLHKITNSLGMVLNDLKEFEREYYYNQNKHEQECNSIEHHINSIYYNLEYESIFKSNKEYDYRFSQYDNTVFSKSDYNFIMSRVLESSVLKIGIPMLRDLIKIFIDQIESGEYKRTRLTKRELEQIHASIADDLGLDLNKEAEEKDTDLMLKILNEFNEQVDEAEDEVKELIKWCKINLRFAYIDTLKNWINKNKKDFDFLQ